jgi:hypothetical protein
MREDYAALYGPMHESEKHFSGKVRHADVVARLVAETAPRSLLDYGSGKGYQYLSRRIHEKWGGLLPYCYDVGVRQLSRRPQGTFDGVLCCDMLEHIEEGDLDEVLGDVFSFASVREPPARSFVFAAINCGPSHKKLPDGRGVHLTVKPPAWWRGKIERFAREGLIIETAFDVGEQAQ